MNADVTKKAVELTNEEKIDEAEDHLIKYISENLEFKIEMIKYVEEFISRQEFIQLAYEDYMDKRYYSCILLLFTIIDGVVVDCKEIEGNKGFFADGNDKNLYAWDSIAAHSTGLAKLQSLLYKNRGVTTTEEIDIPFRNGIIHGRDLGYNNKKVATKLWNTLFALRDGIIAMKNKDENSEEDFNFIKYILDLKLEEDEFELNMKHLNEWKPRKMIKGVDYPESGSSFDYEDKTPERKVVEFFEYWMSNNYGNVVKTITNDYLKEFSINNIAGKLSRDAFNNKNLVSYKIIDITDDAAASSKITTELKIQKENKHVHGSNCIYIII